jgi:hypothetical protein
MVSLYQQRKSLIQGILTNISLFSIPMVLVVKYANPQIDRWCMHPPVVYQYREVER